MGELAQLRKDDTEFGDGEDVEGACDYCESCGEEEFRLKWWQGYRLVVCTTCSQPQELTTWGEFDD